MTVTSTTRRAGPYSGNGVTDQFPFSFKVFSTSDIALTLTDADGISSALVLDTDYSITLNPDQDTSPGGTITYPLSGTPLATGETLVGVGSLPYDQTTDFPPGGKYRAQTVESAFDRTVQQIQQLAEVAGRSLSLPPSAATANAELPAPVATNVIGWNETANALVNYAPADLATVVVAGTSYFQALNGDGSTTQFTLTANPGSVNALDIAVDGVPQKNGIDFTVSGTALTFTSAPPVGTQNIAVRYVAAVPVGSANAQDVTFLPAGTGAVNRTARSKLREFVSVKDFGAVGNNTADDTAAVQVAINYCLANSVSLFVPAGKYRLTSQINVPVFSDVFERGIIIKGEGWGSRFVIDHSGTGFYVSCSPSFGIYQAIFSDLYFTDGTATPNRLIHNDGAINTLLKRCMFHNATVTTACVVNDNAYGLTLQDCIFASIVGVGVQYNQTPNLSTYSYVNSIEGCDFSTLTTGVQMQGCNALQVTNTVFQECNVGFFADPTAGGNSAFNMVFETCWFERNTTYDLQLSSDASYWCEASIRNCQFSGFSPTFQCNIQLGSKSRLTVEGTPAGNTVNVIGSGSAAVILIRATNFVQSGTFAWTSVDPVGNIVAATYKTASGVYPNPASGAAVTLTTLPNVSSSAWLVCAQLDGTGNATNNSCIGVLVTQGATAVYTALKTAATLTVTTSGLNLQGAQTTGGAYSITWSLTRLA